MRRRASLSTLAAAGAIALLVGCGAASSGGTSGTGTNDSTVAPKAELSAAVRALTQGSALTTTLSVGTTSANLIHITGEGGSQPLTQEQADLITGARIVIESTAPQGKTLAQEAAAGADSAAAASITGTTGGKTYFTFLVVDKTLYAQVDFAGIYFDLENDGEPYSNLQSETAHLPQFAQDFVAGKFVAIPFSTISDLTAFLQGALQGSGSSPIPSQDQVKGLITALQSAISSDVTVARTNTGATDDLVVTGNAHTLASDIVATIADAIPSTADGIGPDAVHGVPDQDLTLDASVTGGVLSNASFDFGQFSPHQKDTLPIVATFSQSGDPIAAPADATQVTLRDLTQFFVAVGSSSSVTTGGTTAVPSPAMTTSAP
jgi:hypothetical protein